MELIYLYHRAVLFPHSYRAKVQHATQVALRDWFDAARNGHKGVDESSAVDIVITLGLNYDTKQVWTLLNNANESSGSFRRNLMMYVPNPGRATKRFHQTLRHYMRGWKSIPHGYVHLGDALVSLA